MNYRFIKDDKSYIVPEAVYLAAVEIDNQQKQKFTQPKPNETFAQCRDRWDELHDKIKKEEWTECKKLRNQSETIAELYRHESFFDYWDSIEETNEPTFLETMRNEAPNLVWILTHDKYPNKCVLRCKLINENRKILHKHFIAQNELTLQACPVIANMLEFAGCKITMGQTLRKVEWDIMLYDDILNILKAFNYKQMSYENRDVYDL